MISLQTNVNSLVAQANLSVTSAFQSKTIQQLTSGYRINSAGDDAAGLAVANKFRSSVAELTQGVANGNDAVAQLQIIDGGMSNIGQILDRLKTLSTQSASGAFTGNRSTLNAEFQTDLAEIDRQAQSIGLDTGGTFAKSLGVYLGQGTGSGGGTGGSQALSNASVVVDLTQATVDSGSLGLKGLKAIAGTIGDAGTDIGTGSKNGTTVADIVSPLARNSQAKSGYATFTFAGPGFSDSSAVSVAANLSGVSDANSLATAINTAIGNAAGGATQAAGALKSAGIVATVNTDQYGHQQLAFSSGTAAFQVQAGDQMANALMGNFAGDGSATGKTVTSTVTGGSAGVSTAAFDPTNVSVQISGAGLSGPVTLHLSTSDHFVSDATTDLINQVNQSKPLQDAGISVALKADNTLQFTNASGATFSVSSVGDRANALGLGTFVTTSALNGAVSYSDITAGSTLSSAATGNGIATLGFSLNGGATGGITAATVTGSASAAGYNGVGTVGNAAGALGSMTLTLNGNATPVTVNFGSDANQSATETVQQAADFINSQIQSQAGYGSDVKFATVDSTTNAIKLTGPADGAGTIVAAGAAAGALGLTEAAGANIVAASGGAGDNNTVSVNLAAGDASSGALIGTAGAAANIATGASATMAMNIDGKAITANFSGDVNAPGKAAAFISSNLAASDVATLDISALQGGKASVTGGAIANVSTASDKVDLAGFAAVKATTTGIDVGTAAGVNAVVDLHTFMATKATTVSTALDTTGAVNDNPTNIASLVSGFKSKVASVTTVPLGTDANTAVGAGSAIDVTQFTAKAAQAKSTTQLLGSSLDFATYGAKAAVLTKGIAVAADNTSSIAAVTALGATGADNLLTISVTDGSGVTHTDNLQINNVAGGSLDAVKNAINGDTTLNSGGKSYVVASVLNGVLTLTSGADLTDGAKGAAKTISVTANAASRAVGLATTGQILDSTAQGAAYVGLQLTVDTSAAAQVATTKGTTDLSGGNFSGFNVGQYAATQAQLTGAQVAATGGDPNADISALQSSDTLDITVDSLVQQQIDISGTTLDAVKAKIETAVSGNANLAGLIVSTAGGVLVLTQSAAAGAGHSITVVNNAASQALGLAATGLSSTSKAFVGVKVQVDAVTVADVDISAATDMSDLASKVNSGIRAASGGNNSFTYATATDGTLTIHGELAGATTGSKVDITNNAVSVALGLTTIADPGTKHIGGTAAYTGNTSVNVDLSAEDTRTKVQDKINAAFTAVNPNLNAVASIDGTTGIITLNGATAGGASEVNITHSALSNYLGFTSGSTDSLNSGRARQDLVLDVDGQGAKSVDISSQTTLDGIKTQINNSFSGAASIVNGSLKIEGAILGHTGQVDITDNAVSRALKLTTDHNVDVTGTDATKLLLNVDGLGQIGVDVSNCTNLKGVDTVGLAATIQAQVVAASPTGYSTYGAGFATAQVDTDGRGILQLQSKQTGQTTSTIQIVDNAVSQALKLTPGTAIGTDSTKLNLNIDGLGQVAVDLTTFGGGSTGTLSEFAGAINSAVAAAGHGYDGTYDKVATAQVDVLDNTKGQLKLTGVTLGGSVSVSNNLLAKAIGLATGSGDTNVSGAAQTLNLQMDGHQAFKMDLSGLGNAKLSDIAARINTLLSTDTTHGYGAGYAGAAVANPNGTITITGQNGGGSVNITNSQLSNALSLTGNTSNASASGTAGHTLGVSIDGKADTQVNFGTMTGGTQSLAAIAQHINDALTSDTTNYGLAYAGAAHANANGTITISSLTKGSAGAGVTVDNTTAGQSLGFTSGSAASINMKGTDESLSDIVSFLNETAQKALGASTDANIVSMDASGKVTIASQTKGANSSVTVVGSGTTASLASGLNLTEDAAKTGQARSLKTVVAELQQAFNSNATLLQAGLTAVINPSTNSLQIKSSNGTQFSLDAWGTKAGSDLGFGVAGAALSSANTTAKSSASVIETQGASAIGTFANVKNATSMAWKNMQFGNDDQSLTISASNAGGVAQTPLTITLQNDSTAQTGANIDSAISAINTKLQQSENATMRSITAVRETDAQGAESINLISSLSSFNVSVSSSAGAAVGDGLNGGVAKTLSSAVNGAASSIAIDTQAGAQQAVTALGAAIAKLGSAQATIGRGENQLTYSINLATSQITNFSAAESQIRDTNVAQQAANLSKAQVLSQAAIAAMAQANSAPQAVLSLLRG